MSEQQGPETEYARRLRAELTTIVADRGAERAAHTSRSAPTGKPVWHRRGPRLGLAGAAVAVIAVVALIVGASGDDTPAAFAIEAESEGYVSVEIHSLEDASGLEEALGQAGIPASVTYLQSGMACKEPRFQPASGPKAARVMVTGSGDSGPMVFRVDSEGVGSGLTLVITASPSTYATFDTFQAEFAEGTVAPCDQAPAP
jgi:hypothetical protein